MATDRIMAATKQLTAAITGIQEGLLEKLVTIQSLCHLILTEDPSEDPTPPPLTPLPTLTLPVIDEKPVPSCKPTWPQPLSVLSKFAPPVHSPIKDNPAVENNVEEEHPSPIALRLSPWHQPHRQSSIHMSKLPPAYNHLQILSANMIYAVITEQLMPKLTVGTPTH
jgi:hypothetical protein